MNLTTQVAWSSSSVQIATIGAATGLATAVGQGTATITALYSSNGTVVTGTATFSVSGGVTEKYIAVSILPGAQALSASGQTGQFIALGTSGTTGLQTNVTNSSQITWSSSIPTVATVSATGLATGVGVGSTTITAQLTNADGTVVSNTASIAVSLTSPPEPLLSLTIIPNSITVDNLQDTGQFLAIGTFSTAPYVRDLTNTPTTSWISDVPSVFPVDTNSGGNSGATAGLVTAFGSGNANIIAEATGSDGTIQTASATFNCPLALPNPNGDPPTPGTCIPGTQAQALLSTLTIYNEGPNTTTWEVTAPSATGQANVIHCGPGWSLNAAPNNTGGSVCVATYPLPATTTLGVGVTILITASQPSLPTGTGTFGGWSYNCTPSTSTGVALTAPPYYSLSGPNYCTVKFLPTLYDSSGNLIQVGNTNVTVGAIFN
ncbi:MAG: Ig-like domain-containing protein [Acidobacteriaceae bacterium]